MAKPEFESVGSLVQAVVGDAPHWLVREQETDAGAFWERVNTIALDQRPVLLIVINSGITSKRRATDISVRIRAFGIDGAKVFHALGRTDRVLAYAVEQSRAGPYFLEIMEPVCA